MARPALKTLKAAEQLDPQGALRRLLRAGKIHSLEHGVKIGVVEVDAELAADVIVNCNTKNRTVRENRVRRYKDQMIAGRWRLVNPILMSDAGDMIDGQHRFKAVAEAGKPIRFLLQIVPFAHAMEVNLATDEGVIRNLADTLKTHQGHLIKRQKRVAPVLVYEMSFRVVGDPMKGQHRPKEDYLKLLAEIGPETIENALDLVPVKLSKLIGVPRPILDWFAVALQAIDRSMAEMFFQMLFDDSMLRATDPVKVLREELMALARKQQRGRVDEATVERFVMIAKGWNRFYTDMPTKSKDIRYKARERFPMLKGEE